MNFPMVFPDPPPIAAPVDPVPAQIARQAFEEMPLDKREEWMEFYMQGGDPEPMLQAHMHLEIQRVQQKAAEFLARGVENLRRMQVVGAKLNQDLKAVKYLEGLEVQIGTLSQAIQYLKPVEEDLLEAIQTPQARLQQRTIKIQELTAHLHQMQKKLSSTEGHQMAVVQGINQFGYQVSSYVVGLDNKSSRSHKNLAGAPII